MNEEMIIRHGTAREAPDATEVFEAVPLRAGSLAMVYPVRQVFRRLYEPGEALLRRGTLFCELYKPFQPGGRAL